MAEKQTTFRFRAWHLVVALVLASTAVRGFWAMRVPTPWITGDEVIYAELGRSLWQSGALELLDTPMRFYSLIYPALIGGPLSLPDLDAGYALAKWLQAFAMSLAAVPVYLWARALASRGWALAAAVLTVTVPGLAYSGLLMTEVAFYPVLVLAAWAIAKALEHPTPQAQGLALAAIALACLTRLQALVLVPAYLTAVLVKLTLDRHGLRPLRRHLPAIGGLTVLAAAWSAWQVADHDGRAAGVLGAYRAAGEASYDVGDAAKFVAYHAADVVLLTAVLPACAVALLAVGRRSPAVNAYLAVTLALTAWFVLEVGVFASRHIGTVAERNLFGLAPLYFVGFAVWLDRGARRDRVPGILVALAAVALVAALPLRSLLTAAGSASLYDAFMLVPLYELGSRRPEANLRLLLLAVVLGLLALGALVETRELWILPVALAAVFVVVSAFATRTTISQATTVQEHLIGPKKRWADRGASGPIAFLTGGESAWSAVYETLFWNRDLERVYTLPGFAVPGPLPQTPVGPQRSGVVVLANGRPAQARNVIASHTITLVGTKLAAPRGAKLALWRVRQPLRMSTWLTGLGILRSRADARGNLSVTGSIDSDAKLVVYRCSGAFELALVAAGEAPSAAVEVRRDGAVVRRAQIGAFHGWHATIPTQPGRAQCELEIRTSARVDVKWLELRRSTAPGSQAVRSALRSGKGGRSAVLLRHSGFQRGRHAAGAVRAARGRDGPA